MDNQLAVLIRTLTPPTRPGKVQWQEGGRRKRVRAADRKGVEKATQEGREVEEALWRSEVTAQAEATRRARLRRQQEFLEFRHLQVGEGLRARVVWWLLHDVWTAEFC